MVQLLMHLTVCVSTAGMHILRNFADQHEHLCDKSTANLMSAYLFAGMHMPNVSKYRIAMTYYGSPVKQQKLHRGLVDTVAIKAIRIITLQYPLLLVCSYILSPF